MKRSKRKKGRKVAIQDARTHGEFVQNVSKYGDAICGRQRGSCGILLQVDLLPDRQT